MSNIITTIITAVTAGAKGLASALIDTFDALAYKTSGETTAMTTLFETMLIFVGFSIACSVLGKVFSLIRGKLRKRA